MVSTTSSGLAAFNTLALASIWASRLFRARPWATAGLSLAWLSWASVVLDIPENLAYLRMVFGTVDDPWPQVLKACAVFRTGVFVIGVAYVELAVVVWAFRKLRMIRGDAY